MRHLARLEALDIRGIKLGLAAIDALCERLGRPERAYPTVLVGGTNGKGSTAATLSALAAAGGRRAGLYTSPHLVSVTERVRVGESDVSEPALDRALAHVFDAADRGPAISVTYFEVMTAAAFWLFRDEHVDLAVLEVGMGGRFDATNVAPAGLSIVVSIGLDHMAELGDTLPRIAFEKAGIFRRGRPALVRAEDASALAELASAAEASGALWHDASRELSIHVESVGPDGTAFTLSTPEKTLAVRTPLAGRHQAWNAALALRGVELDPAAFGRPDEAALRRGVAAVRWPGRLERIERSGAPTVLLDGCHNPDGARALAGFLEDAGLAGRVPLVFGAMADKDVEGIARALFPKVAEVVLVPAGSPRAATVEDLEKRVGPFAAKVRKAGGVAAALALFDGGGGVGGPAAAPIIVAGSLYLVGEARAALSDNSGGTR